MTLELSGGGLEINNWLKVVDNKIIGLIWDIDVPKRYQYTLTAVDSGGLKANHDLEINVIDPTSKPTNLFTLTIDSVFSKFTNDFDQQVDLYAKLRLAFDDAVVRFNSVREGSVVVEFSAQQEVANALNRGVCAQVEELRDRVFTQSGMISSEFTAHLEPHRITKLSFIALAPCEDSVDPIEVEIEIPKTDKNKGEYTFNILFVIIPVSIIGALLIIVVIVIVVVCVKRRHQKSMYVNKSNGTYIEKGVPVVFEEEMKDRKDAHLREPLMEESSTPQPPAYPRNAETAPLNGKTDPNHQLPTPPMSEHE